MHMIKIIDCMPYGYGVDASQPVKEPDLEDNIMDDCTVQKVITWSNSRNNYANQQLKNESLLS